MFEISSDFSSCYPNLDSNELKELMKELRLEHDNFVELSRFADLSKYYDQTGLTDEGMELDD